MRSPSKRCRNIGSARSSLRRRSEARCNGRRAGGGANWGGAAFDAASGYLFVRAANGVTNNRIGKNDGSDTLVDVEYSNQFAARGAGSGLGPIPLIKPPYATLTALDLNKGEIAWQTPVGEGSPAVRNHPLLKDVKLPDRLGSDSKGGAIVTAGGLVFVGGGDKYLYAFDKMTGREVWRGVLPYTNAATPMTYRTRSGQQFIVVATGTASESALVAFALAGNHVRAFPPPPKASRTRRSGLRPRRR